jgi:hypothetical protein
MRFVRSPAYNKLKTPTKAGGKASHAQCFKADGQNFASTQNFAQNEHLKIQNLAKSCEAKKAKQEIEQKFKSCSGRFRF